MNYHRDIPYETSTRQRPRCFSSLVPKIIKTTAIPKTATQIKKELGCSLFDEKVNQTLLWLEEHGRINIGPDINNEPTWQSLT